LISDSIVEKTGNSEIDDVDTDLEKALLENTKHVADLFSAGFPFISNRLNNHLILTQKLIMANRKTPE
jgi:hypothetical protein